MTHMGHHGYWHRSLDHRLISLLYRAKMSVASRNPSQEWKTILDTLREYYRRTKDKDVAGYSHQLLLLAEYSYVQRKETGGWAGEFTRTLLLIGAMDTHKRQEYWEDVDDDWWWRWLCIGSIDGLCESYQAGEEHFSDHLEPGFYEYVKARLQSIGRGPACSSASGLIRDDIEKIIDEHEDLLQHGVKPASIGIPEFGPEFVRALIGMTIIADARELRNKVLIKVCQDLVREGILSRSSLRSIINDFHLLSSPNFLDHGRIR